MLKLYRLCTNATSVRCIASFRAGESFRSRKRCHAILAELDLADDLPGDGASVLSEKGVAATWLRMPGAAVDLGEVKSALSVGRDAAAFWGVEALCC